MLRENVRKGTTLFLCTLIHFLVDLSCVYFMSAVIRPVTVTQGSWLFRVLLYNGMAFAFPALAGLAADLFLKKKHLWMSCAGCLLILAGYLLHRYAAAAVFLVGLGNGFFHIGGGIEVMNDAGKSYAAPGIFIASGALGVFLGNTWGRQYMPLWQVFRLLMLVSAAAVALWAVVLKKAGPEASAQSGGKNTDAPERVMKINSRLSWFPAALAGLFLIVWIRSYYGSIQMYSWKNTFTVGLLFTLCVMGGKASGGLLADRIGLEKAAAVSLGAAAVTALFSMNSAVFGCISIFFFNMTMPLTLSLLTALLPSLPGFAFGLLMLALFLGILPTLVWNVHWLFSGPGMALLCVISLAVLLWAAVRMRKEGEAS